MDSDIYHNPALYDLEHTGKTPDVDYFCRMVEQFRPQQILEFGCGNGRVTIPVANAASAWGGRVTGMDVSESMLANARSSDGADNVSWLSHDITKNALPTRFDFIFSCCSSLCHLFKTEDQIAAWRNAYAALNPGGRFVVGELMPDLPTIAESMTIPPRANIHFESDKEDPDAENPDRLLRFRIVRYFAQKQETHVRYLYDLFPNGKDCAERHYTDHRAHVFFPNELKLLFLMAGFELEAIHGSYLGEPLHHHSRHLIVTGRRPL